MNSSITVPKEASWNITKEEWNTNVDLTTASVNEGEENESKQGSNALEVMDVKLVYKS